MNEKNLIEAIINNSIDSLFMIDNEDEFKSKKAIYRPYFLSKPELAYHFGIWIEEGSFDEELKAVIKPDPFWFGKVEAYEKTGEVFGIRNVKITRYIQEVILDKFFPDDYNG